MMFSKQQQQPQLNLQNSKNMQEMASVILKTCLASVVLLSLVQTSLLLKLIMFMVALIVMAAALLVRFPNALQQSLDLSYKDDWLWLVIGIDNPFRDYKKERLNNIQAQNCVAQQRLFGDDFDSNDRILDAFNSRQSINSSELDVSFGAENKKSNLHSKSMLYKKKLNIMEEIDKKRVLEKKDSKGVESNVTFGLRMSRNGDNISQMNSKMANYDKYFSEEIKKTSEVLEYSKDLEFDDFGVGSHIENNGLALNQKKCKFYDKEEEKKSNIEKFQNLKINIFDQMDPLTMSDYAQIVGKSVKQLESILNFDISKNVLKPKAQIITDKVPQKTLGAGLNFGGLNSSNKAGPGPFSKVEGTAALLQDIEAPLPEMSLGGLSKTTSKIFGSAVGDNSKLKSSSIGSENLIKGNLPPPFKKSPLFQNQPTLKNSQSEDLFQKNTLSTPNGVNSNLLSPQKDRKRTLNKNETDIVGFDTNQEISNGDSGLLAPQNPNRNLFSIAEEEKEQKPFPSKLTPSTNQQGNLFNPKPMGIKSLQMTSESPVQAGNNSSANVFGFETKDNIANTTTTSKKQGNNTFNATSGSNNKDELIYNTKISEKFKQIRKDTTANSQTTQQYKASIKEILSNFFGTICMEIDNHFLQVIETLMTKMTEFKGLGEEVYVEFVKSFAVSFVIDNYKTFKANKVKTAYMSLVMRILCEKEPFLFEVLSSIVFNKFPFLHDPKILEGKDPKTDPYGYYTSMGFDPSKDVQVKSKQQILKHFNSQDSIEVFFKRLEVYCNLYYGTLSVDLEHQLRDFPQFIQNHNLQTSNTYNLTYKYYSSLEQILMSCPEPFQPLLIKQWFTIGSDLWQGQGRQKLQKATSLVQQKVLGRLSRLFESRGPSKQPVTFQGLCSPSFSQELTFTYIGLKKELQEIAGQGFVKDKYIKLDQMYRQQCKQVPQLPPNQGLMPLKLLITERTYIFNQNQIIKDIMSQANALFNRFDSNNDGSISRQEVRGMYQQAGVTNMTDADLNRQMRRMDADGDGVITRQELQGHVHASGATIGYRYRGAPAHIQQLFTKYDQNRDGFLDRNELRAFYSAAGAHLDDQQLDIQLKYIGAGPRGVDQRAFASILSINK